MQYFVVGIPPPAMQLSLIWLGYFNLVRGITKKRRSSLRKVTSMSGQIAQLYFYVRYAHTQANIQEEQEAVSGFYRKTYWRHGIWLILKARKRPNHRVEKCQRYFWKVWKHADSIVRTYSSRESWKVADKNWKLQVHPIHHSHSLSKV